MAILSNFISNDNCTKRPHTYVHRSHKQTIHPLTLIQTSRMQQSLKTDRNTVNELISELLLLYELSRKFARRQEVQGIYNK